MKRIDFPKLTKISIIILLAFFLVAVIIVIVGKTNLLDKGKSVFEEPFILHQSLVAPKPPSTPDEYYLMRSKDYSWTQEDIERWFSPPNQELLDSLNTANDEIISNIVEGAP